MPKKRIIGIIIVLSVVFVAMFINDAFLKKRQFVIISTNDIHSSIDNIPRLATLVKGCRDTIETILLDAGDRWTGGSYVDLAKGRRPILDLLGKVGLTAGALGNHEFDMGPSFLDDAIKYSNFSTICCNLKSDTIALNNPKKFLTLRLSNGLKLFITGVVSTAENSYPEGAKWCFKNLSFCDPILSAHGLLKESRGCDMRILLSHMGDVLDCRYASEYGEYDLIIGGHTHAVVDTLVNGVTIGQTGLKLKRAGLTLVKFRGRKIESIAYRNIDLTTLSEDSVISNHVRRIKDNPELARKVGSLSHGLNFIGMANLITSIIKDATYSDIGIYHYGGIRLSSLPKGDVPLCAATDIDPFHSQIVILEMTAEQIRKAILAKYNDTGNVKDSHQIDLMASVPYTIVTDAKDNAVDVIFPTLDSRKKYRVALSDYVANQYPGLEYSSRTDSEIYVIDAINHTLEKHSPLDISCEPKQSKIVR
ncbi:MAG: 5'-nucleotidase C-terminal domain-containing protein [Alistipes sp.]|nr:5'-nucleotidase C-terminal domain-containing protein [Candidatus Alistipes equi]